ncbi:hypothetical protein C8R45DRAFT_1115375 [Mycena sanguinolenta]|nr:hypothetical protein C8R45DRAFT_1115375 [Mycena sanguinolenta]
MYANPRRPSTPSAAPAPKAHPVPSEDVDAANARTPDATWKYGWKDYILPVRGRLFSHRINDKFIANADVPAILNLQPRLLVPHLSFNTIGSLPAILTFRAINALRRRCESSCCRLPLSLSRIAKQFVHGDLAPHHSARACSSAMIHTGELPMEAALCALLVRLTTRFYNADSPTICLEAPTRVLLASQMPSRSSTFCFAHLHDDAAASLSVPMKSDLPLRCRRCTSASAWGASVRSRCRSARMMEADDGESREHARPRIAAYPTLTLRRGLCSCVPDRIPNRIRGFPALRRRLTPRACGTFTVLVKSDFISLLSRPFVVPGLRFSPGTIYLANSPPPQMLWCRASKYCIDVQYNDRGFDALSTTRNQFALDSPKGKLSKRTAPHSAKNDWHSLQGNAERANSGLEGNMREA